MTGYENAIEIKNLSKRYEGFALKNIDFVVPKGSIMGFVGQNGAGKTTTIRSILNIISKDSGRISVLGLDHIKDEEEIKERIAVVFDEVPFHGALTPKQLNKVLKGMYKRWEEDTFYGYLERFSLPPCKKLGQFSKGMKMKLQIAAALSHGAELLIMDEATAGLDPVVRSEMLSVFLEYMQDEGHSILMSSHITSDLEKIADSVTFIHGGQIILTGYKDDILAAHGVIKCKKAQLEEIDIEDIVSTHITEYGAEVMVADRNLCRKKYTELVMDAAALDEILLFYVKAKSLGDGRREWSL